MTFQALHDLNSGTVTKNSFTLMSNGTNVEKCTTKDLISVALGNSSDLEFNNLDSLSIKDGVIGESNIANNAISASKIQDGAIDLSKVKTDGPSSFPVNVFKRKTICLHVGNYYRNSGYQKASDSLNYNSSIQRYEARSEVIVNSTDDESMNLVWGDIHSDSTEVHVVEPFATLSAAARFAQYNYGPNLNAIFLIHGHVCAVGEYDINLNKRIAQVDRWSGFNNIAITAGSAPGYTMSDSHYVNYFSSSTYGKLAARIDWDHTVKNGATDREKTFAFDFSGPNVVLSGVNFVFSAPTGQNVSLVQNRFQRGEHYINGVRMASLGDIDDFIPYFGLNSSSLYFGDADMPDTANEFVFKENGTLFKIQSGSQIRYGKNSDNNDILIEAYASSANIKFCRLIEGSTFDIGSQNTEVYYKSSSSLNNNHPAVTLQFGLNRFLSDMGSSYYIGGKASSGFQFEFINSDADLMYESGSSISDAANRKNYTSASAVSESLYSKATKITNTTYRERITSSANFMSMPTTRSNDPYSDQ